MISPAPSTPRDVQEAHTNVPTPRKRPWFVILVLCLVPFCFMGYGSDNDTYGVIESGVITWHQHAPQTSRHPGYWVFEALVYVLSSLGGYALMNLATLFVSGIICWRLYVTAQRLRAPYPLLLVACLLATPVYLIASTSTDDYVWSLLCIVLAGEMFLSDRMVLAAVLGGFAIGLRGSNSVVFAGGVAALIVFEIVRDRRVTRRAWRTAASGFGAALLAAPVYWYSYHHVGSMEFLSPMIGPPEMWTLKMTVGRFLYKGMYLLGPFASLICVLAAANWLTKRWKSERIAWSFDEQRLRFLCWGFLLGNLALYLKFPLEVSYMLPGLFYFLLLAGCSMFAGSRLWILAFLTAILSLNFVLPQFAQPNVSGKATEAKLHFSWSSGTLVQDVRARRAVVGCVTNHCWELRSASQPHQ